MARPKSVSVICFVIILFALYTLSNFFQSMSNVIGSGVFAKTVNLPPLNKVGFSLVLGSPLIQQVINIACVVLMLKGRNRGRVIYSVVSLLMAALIVVLNLMSQWSNTGEIVLLFGTVITLWYDAEAKAYFAQGRTAVPSQPQPNGV